MKNKTKTFIEVAKLFAQNSTCCSKQVGGCLVVEDRIIATGFNGVPSGTVHCEDLFTIFEHQQKVNTSVKKITREEHHNWSLKNELHCEQNMISWCAKHGISTKGSELFITVSPCRTCALLIIQAGIKKVYYLEEYDLSGGIELLKENGIDLECLKEK